MNGNEIQLFEAKAFSILIELYYLCCAYDKATVGATFDVLTLKDRAPIQTLSDWGEEGSRAPPPLSRKLL